MKKESAAMLLALLLTGGIAACETDTAWLKVYNNTGEQVVELHLEGEESSGNLLGTPLEDQEVRVLEDADLLPGTYHWRVVYGPESFKPQYESSRDLELWPGRNNIELNEFLN